MKKLLKLGLLISLLSINPFAFAGVVNINTADAQTLADNIKGVGKAKAQAIIDFREEHGPFKSVDEMTQVKGIGLKLINNNRDNLTIKDE